METVLASSSAGGCTLPGPDFTLGMGGYFLARQRRIGAIESTWQRVRTRILLRPKLSSILSIEPAQELGTSTRA